MYVLNISYLHSPGVFCRVGANLEKSSLSRSRLTSFPGCSSLVHNHRLPSEQTHQVGRFLPLDYSHLVDRYTQIQKSSWKAIFASTFVFYEKIPHAFENCTNIPKVCNKITLGTMNSRKRYLQYRLQTRGGSIGPDCVLMVWQRLKECELHMQS